MRSLIYTRLNKFLRVYFIIKLSFFDDKTFTVYVVYYDSQRLEDGEKSFSEQILMFYDH